MKRQYIFHLDDKLHKKFKDACYKRNKVMGDEIEKQIKFFCKWNK